MTREEHVDWLCRLRADLNNGVLFTPWKKEFTEAVDIALEQEPTPKKDEINICDSCGNMQCIFQYGIIRKKCDYYMPKDNLIVKELKEILAEFEKANPWDNPKRIIQTHIDRLESTKCM